MTLTQTGEKRGPGRPRKDAEERRRRTDRKSLLGYQLSVAEEKLDLANYKYRWINDDEARIFAKTKQDDWNLVSQEGSEIKGDASPGSAICKVVGKSKEGQPVRAYLARKRKDWWEADQRQKNEEIEDMMSQMRAGRDPDGSQPEGTYALPHNRL